MVGKEKRRGEEEEEKGEEEAKGLEFMSSRHKDHIYDISQVRSFYLSFSRRDVSK